MLTEEENALLMQTQPGTRMGELMRRYWQPIAAVGEFDTQPIKAIRLLGEDLVLYKDRSGTFGLLERHCAHRRADLSYGVVEDCGLRCNYHGWRYDETGQCIEQPFDDLAYPEAHFKEKIRLRAYPVQAKAGLLWAYLGPSPAPLLPDWGPFHWENGMVQLVFTEVPCNWFQCQENSIDPVHFEWLHSYWSYELRGRSGAPAPRHIKVGFDEFDYGFVYRRIQEGMDETHPLWTVGRTCLWPNALYTGDHFEWRVPVDDTTTLSVGWFFDALAPGHELPGGKRYYHWYSPIKEAETGRWINSHTMNQDFVAWVGQGALADRSLEHLSPSDRGVILMRQKMFEQMDVVAEGGDPTNIFRDPALNRELQLPHPRTGTSGGPVTASPRFPFLAEQPSEIAEIYRQVKAGWGQADGYGRGRTPD
ncbi:MAG: aromatic ring-hydroxylating dioxygenase subunit alpha [Chloroflexi bacterium]|nr:aromatic ring-hydroxylating dioxygenase subunit alpha [Chloroflexota bacterium]